ncbi:MAG: fibronectin type III domain-containing protein, partial [Bacteroidales bacterium]|nr:fibronectin type III domain-containing protein [Bacteroidales bacterium]
MNNSGLLINDHFNRVAIHPNDSYFTTNSSGKTSLEDPSQNWTSNDISGGGQVSVRAVNWAWSVGKITSSTSTSLNFTELLFEMKKKPTYYYLQNVPVGLDKHGEWVFDNSRLSVYYEGNLNAQKVEFPVVDTVLNLKSVKNILFSGIEFRGANGILINLQNGMNIHFEKCTFRMAGTGFDIDESYNSNFSDNHFEYLHTNGITANKIGSFNINDNSFRHIHTIRGMNNDYDDWSACIAMKNNVGEVNVRYNTFDTVMIAFQTHWSEANWFFERNLIKDYTYILGDVGGVYCGGDWRRDITKSIKENIFLNAHTDMETSDGNHIGGYGHGVYWDYDSNGIRVDGNTFINANGAIYSNRNNNNTAVNNKFINCAKDLKEFWGMYIFMDNLIDGTNDIAYHNFTGNTFVFGNNQNDRAFGYHNSSTSSLNWESITIQNNTYQSPYYNNLIHREINNYSNDGNYSLSEMCSRRNYDCSSSYHPLNHFYKDVTGVTPEEFTKVVFNASKVRDTVLLDHTYIDLKGVKYSGVIYLEPYETKVLFFHSGTVIRDTEKPDAPSGLKADDIGETEVKISWNPSNDNFGVSGYSIYVNESKNAETTKTNHVIYNLSPETKYTIYITARDAAFNYSNPSGTIEVTTKKNEEPQDTTVNEEPQDTIVINEPSDTTVIEDTASQVNPEPEDLPEVSIVNVVNSTEMTQTVAKVSFFGKAEIEQFGVMLSEDAEFVGEVKEYSALPEEIRVNNDDRVTKNLQLFYNFSEGKGNLIR